MGEKLVCVNTYLIFRGENEDILIFPGGEWVWGKNEHSWVYTHFSGGKLSMGKNEYATPEHLWNFNGYSHSLVHPEIIFPSRFSLSKNNFWNYETLIVRDYERHWLTRLWETLIEQDYERRCLNETMRDTDWTRLWKTLFEQDYERHWLYEIYDLMGNRSKL